MRKNKYDWSIYYNAKLGFNWPKKVSVYHKETRRFHGFGFIHYLAIVPGYEKMFKWLCCLHPELIKQKILPSNEVLGHLNTFHILIMLEREDLVNFLLTEEIRYLAVKGFWRNRYIPESIQDLIIEYVDKPDYSREEVSELRCEDGGYSLILLAAERMNMNIIRALQKHNRLLAQERRKNTYRKQKNVLEGFKVSTGQRRASNALKKALLKSDLVKASKLLENAPYSELTAIIEKKPKKYAGYTVLDMIILNHNLQAMIALLLSSRYRDLFLKHTVKNKKNPKSYGMNLIQFLIVSDWEMKQKTIGLLVRSCPKLATETVESDESDYQYMNALCIAIEQQHAATVYLLMGEVPACAKEEILGGRYKGFDPFDLTIMRLESLVILTKLAKDSVLAKRKIGGDNKRYVGLNKLQLAALIGNVHAQSILLALYPYLNLSVVKDHRSDYYGLNAFEIAEKEGKQAEEAIEVMRQHYYQTMALILPQILDKWDQKHSIIEDLQRLIEVYLIMPLNVKKRSKAKKEVLIASSNPN